MSRRYRFRSCFAAAVSTLLVVGVTASGGSAGATPLHSHGGSGTRSVLTIQGDRGNPTLVEDFNPLVASSRLGGSYLIYEPLMFQSTVTGKLVPFLATSDHFASPTSLVFTLRRGVKWSDGHPFSTADVVFTFDLLKKYPALDSNGVWQQVSSVSADGDKVTFTLKAPDVWFAGIVAGTPIVPKHLWSGVSDPAKYADTHPVGTGPFMLAKFSPTQYTLKKNPSYWQASKIAPNEVVFPAQSTSQSTNQFQVTSGRFDWAYNYLPDVKETYVARDPKHNTYWFPPGGAIGLYLNLTKAPYDNVNFRRGLSLAFDRSDIAAKAVNGYEGPASQSGIILPNLKSWLDPSLPNQGVVKENRKKALADFAKAGYKLRGGKLDGHDGKQATMTITVPNSYSDWIAASREIITELGQVGIKASLNTPQYAAYSQTIYAGTFEAALGGYGGTGVPYTDLNNALNSTFATPVHTPTTNNFERYHSPKADHALAALAAALGHGPQEKATYTLEKIMTSDVPIVLLYYGGSWGIFSTKHFTGWPSAKDPYTLPTPYNYSLLDVVAHLKKA